MQLETRQENGWTVVRVEGRLDTQNAGDFEARCAELVDGGATGMVLDHSGLVYVSSAGLRGVLTTAKRARAAGGELAVAALSGVTKEVFSISGFDAILPTHPDVATAVGGAFCLKVSGSARALPELSVHT